MLLIEVKTNFIKKIQTKIKQKRKEQEMNKKLIIENKEHINKFLDMVKSGSFSDDLLIQEFIYAYNKAGVKIE